MKRRLPRREFLGRATLGLAGASLWAGPLESAPAAPRAVRGPKTLVDTHVHFYDPTRPQGVPWPPQDDAVLCRTVLPRHYKELPAPQPATGVVVVEASPWIEDNQWVLDLAKEDRLILGLVGSLPVGTGQFQGHLKRLAANPLFRGIRLRPTPERPRWTDRAFLADLKRLADQGLSLDLVGGVETLSAAEQFTKAIAGLRVVIDHMAGARMDGQAPTTEWREALKVLARRRHVFMKVSGLVEGTGRRGGQAPRDGTLYQRALDVVWDLLGADRLIYGSNWPVCEHFAPLSTVQQIALDYFGAKGQAALDKVFAGNARKAYRISERIKPAK